MKLYYFLIVSVLFFSCKEENKSLLKDIDGNVYKTIKVGNTSWMAENLRTTHYQNGDPIIHLEEFNEWINTSSGAYCYYNNDDSIEKIYGKLYNWYSVDDDRNICPIGWQVPSYRDFQILDSTYGGAAVSGKHLKLENNLWYDFEGGVKSDNSSGFSAIPAGHRNENNFERIRRTAFFWNREDNYKDDFDFQKCCAHECSLRTGYYFLQDEGYKERGFSIRCVKNGFQKPDSIIPYSYKIIDKKKEEILKYGSFEMLLTNEEWIPRLEQLKLIYNYDTAEIGDFDRINNEQTGWRKNNKEFYIHPPRSYNLEILEYAPFPYVNFDTTITQWIDTFVIPENSGWPIGLDNSVFYQKYNVTKTDKFNYTAKAVSIRGSDTSYIRYNYNFKRGFTNYEYDILDSLTIFIYQE